jgi:hypothetical protein
MSNRELAAAFAVAFALSVPTLWYANEMRQLFTLKREALERLSLTERELDVALNAREQALSTQQRASSLLELFSQSDSLQLFLAVSNVLGQDALVGKLQLAEWDQRPQQLKFTLAAIAGVPPPPTALIKALESIPMFRDVEARTDGSRVNITIRLVNPGTPLREDVPKPSAGLLPASRDAKPTLSSNALPLNMAAGYPNLGVTVVTNRAA